ncbi:MAG: methylmalonyl Co-A mutase-associated GTPase MeaB [Rhodobacterales bacterium]|jgi:LAO/AO transport system kinase|tara:strand:+ start:1125 stop:2090 length:966 start_codon:yes stop_codon:yes gene_type:complete
MQDQTAEKPGLAARLLAGQTAALARAISIVDRDGQAVSALLKTIQPHLGRAIVVGFTGPPGAGKSTLVNAFIGEMRARGRTVAVAAVDPSSPITGGAVLGDRIRMAEHTMDAGVFIRSLASRGHLGGLSASAARVADLMDAAGFDVIVLETVGAGQSEVEMAEMADVRIVISAPGLGDDVQAIKAGILEIADILVVNKSDLPLAKRTVGQLQAMLALRAPGDWKVPVLATNAVDRTGLCELADAVDRRAATRKMKGPRNALGGRTRRLLAQSVAKYAEHRVLNDTCATIDAVVSDLQQAGIGLDDAITKVLMQLCESQDNG